VLSSSKEEFEVPNNQHPHWEELESKRKRHYSPKMQMVIGARFWELKMNDADGL